MNHERESVVLVVSNDLVSVQEIHSALGNMVKLLHVDDTKQALGFLLSRGTVVDVILCDRGYLVADCAALFNEVAASHPHVQCVLAFQEHELSNVINAKNQVTAMSVLLLPWEAVRLERLVLELLDRALAVRRRETLLRKSMIDELRGTRESRRRLLFQAFPEELGAAVECALSAYLAVAEAIQKDEVRAGLRTFDEFKHMMNEAKRMVQIVAHIREWHKRMAASGTVADWPEIFDCSEGEARIRDVVEQMLPVNGPCDDTVSFQSCGLLAWLLRQPETTHIRLKNGSWTVGPAEFRDSVTATDQDTGGADRPL